jgi:hypothetical protein
MKSLTGLLDKLPHWLVLLVTIFGGGMVAYLTSEPTATLVAAFTTSAGLLSLLKSAAIAGVVAVVAWLKTPPASVNAVKAAAVAAKIAVLVLVVGLFGATSGCLSSAPIVPVTSANSAQVSACQGIASTHNDLVVAGFVVSGGAAGVGAVAAVDENPKDRTGYAIAGGILGAIAVIDTAWTALTSSEFSSSQCSAVVGPLAAKPPNPPPADPTTVTMTPGRAP